MSLRYRVWSLVGDLKLPGLGFMVQGLRYRIQTSGARPQIWGFRMHRVKRLVKYLAS